MIWGKDTSPNTDVLFGSQILKRDKQCKHMGITLCSEYNMYRDICLTRIGAGRQVLLASRGLGSAMVPLAPAAQSKIYWAVGIPKMLYGMEVFPLDDTCINLFEKAHRHHAAVIQNLSHCTPKPGLLATLGWISISSYVAYMKIMFMIRVLCLPIDSIYRKIMITYVKLLISDGFEERLRSPIGSMYRYIRYFNCEHFMMRCIERGRWEDVKTIKIEVKSLILNNEIQRWRASSLMYKEMQLYCERVTELRMHAWWVFVRNSVTAFNKVSCVMALLVGSQPKSFQRNMGSRNCNLCTDICKDTPVHILFECKGLEPHRNLIWQTVLDAMPTAMANHVKNISNYNKFCFIIGGLECDKYIAERQSLYNCIAFKFQIGLMP